MLGLYRSMEHFTGGPRCGRRPKHPRRRTISAQSIN